MLPQRHGRRSKAGRVPDEISLEELQTHYHLSIEVAAVKLKVGLTTLKKLCRKFHIKRWPYRKVQQTQRLAALNWSARAHNSTVQYSHADHMQFLELLIDLDVAPESDLWASFHKDEADIVRETLRETDWVQVKQMLAKESTAVRNSGGSPPTPKVACGGDLPLGAFVRDEAAAAQRPGLTPAGSSSAYPGTPRRGPSMMPSWPADAARQEYPMDPQTWCRASLSQGTSAKTASLPLQQLLDRLQANHTHMQHMAAAAHNMSPHTHAQAVGEYRERVGGTDVSPRPRPMTNPFAAHVVGGGPDFAEWSGGAQPSDATPFMSSTQPRLPAAGTPIPPSQSAHREGSSVQLRPSNIQATLANPFLQRTSLDSLTARRSSDSFNLGSISNRDSLDLLTRLSSGLHSGQSLGLLGGAAPPTGSAKLSSDPRLPESRENSGSGATRWNMPPAAAAAMMQTASSLLGAPLGSELFRDASGLLPADSMGLFSLASLGPLNSLKIGGGGISQQLDPALLNDLAPWALGGSVRKQGEQGSATLESGSGGTTDSKPRTQLPMAPPPCVSKAESTSVDVQQLLQLAASLSQQQPLP